jgi:GntR family transcriptional regulator of vanillate catabolism
MPKATVLRRHAQPANQELLLTNGPEAAAPEARAVPPSPPLTLAQTATDRLRAALLEGRFGPGEKLNEESLSATLQVSRTPVRSALHSLTAEGLLDYVPNRGYSVRSDDLGRLTSIFEVRGVLEGLAARLAAGNGMNEELQAAYRKALVEGDQIMSKGRLLSADRTIFSDVNARIHNTILTAADNRMLHEIIRLCHNIPVSSDRNVLWDDLSWLRRSHDDHHRLFEAILLRDGNRAEHLMREHIHTVKLRRSMRLNSGESVNTDAL